MISFPLANGNGDAMLFEEKCICELCECGLHRCPHASSLRLGHENDVGLSEYENKYAKDFADSSAQSFAYGLSLKRVDDQNFDSTHRADFKAWPTQNVQAVRPVQQYDMPTAAFSASSTHQSDFTRKALSMEPATIRKALSSQWHTSASTAPFTSISTQKADFDQKIAEPPRPFRPSSSVQKSIAPMNATTTHKDDYRVFHISTPPTAFKPQDQSRHFATTPFSSTTEHRANFGKKDVELPMAAIRPKSALHKPSSQPMDLKSTYQEGFTDKQVEKIEPFCQKDQLSLSRGEPFNASTVQQDDYTVKRLKICPAELVLTRRDHSYKRSGMKNGHIMYHRVVRSSIPDVVRYRRMSPVHS